MGLCVRRRAGPRSDAGQVASSYYSVSPLSPHAGASDRQQCLAEGGEWTTPLAPLGHEPGAPHRRVTESPRGRRHARGLAPKGPTRHSLGEPARGGAMSPEGGLQRPWRRECRAIGMARSREAPRQGAVRAGVFRRALPGATLRSARWAWRGGEVTSTRCPPGLSWLRRHELGGGRRQENETAPSDGGICLPGPAWDGTPLAQGAQARAGGAEHGPVLRVAETHQALPAAGEEGAAGDAGDTHSLEDMHGGGDGVGTAE